MFDILLLIPGKRKPTSSGWISFNAVCCAHRGHRADKRSRGGIKFESANKWSYHCFNCGFTANFVLGRRIGQKTKQLLQWCGVDDVQIQKWSLESLKQKDLIELIQTKKHQPTRIKFKEHHLPDAEMIDVDNPLHKIYIDYLHNRKINPIEYPFLVTPEETGRQSKRIIIPYTFNNKIVGHTSRYIDNRLPKYINEQQPGYVFGYDFQKEDWQVCILVEGIFDALSLNACAFMHNTISNEQAELIAQLNKQVIFVPDQDKTGLETCERALELGYSVSIPHWETGVKDVNDAVVKYGKLPTLLSILQSATRAKVKIKLRGGNIGKGI